MNSNLKRLKKEVLNSDKYKEIDQNFTTNKEKNSKIENIVEDNLNQMRSNGKVDRVYFSSKAFKKLHSIKDKKEFDEQVQKCFALHPDTIKNFLDPESESKGKILDFFSVFLGYYGYKSLNNSKILFENESEISEENISYPKILKILKKINKEEESSDYLKEFQERLNEISDNIDEITQKNFNQLIKRGHKFLPNELFEKIIDYFDFTYSFKNQIRLFLNSEVISYGNKKAIIYAVIISNIFMYSNNKTDFLIELYNSEIDKQFKELILLGLSISTLMYSKNDRSGNCDLNFSEVLLKDLNLMYQQIILFVDTYRGLQLDDLSMWSSLMISPLKTKIHYFHFETPNLNSLVGHLSTTKFLVVQKFINNLESSALTEAEKQYIFPLFLFFIEKNRNEEQLLQEYVLNLGETKNKAQLINDLRDLFIFINHEIRTDLLLEIQDVFDTSESVLEKHSIFFGSSKTLLHHYVNQQKYDKAIECFSQNYGNDDNLNDDELLVIKAQLYYWKKQIDKAVVVFPIAIQPYVWYDPKPNPKQQIENILKFLSKKHDIKLLEEDEDCLCILGNIYKRQNESKKATSCFEKAITINSESRAKEYLKI